MTDEYWAVSFPGLTEEGARQILSRAKLIGWDGYEVDPAYFYKRQMDRGTVELLVPVIRAGLQAIGEALPDAERWGAYSMLDDMSEWLSGAADVTYD